MSLSILAFIIYALAVFRLSVLLADDSGPFKFITKTRSFLRREEKKSLILKKSDVAHGAECTRCNSLWFALPVAMFGYFHRRIWDWLATTGDIMIIALAYSALSILFNRMFPKR